MIEVRKEIVILLEARIFFFFLTVYMGDKNSGFASSSNWHYGVTTSEHLNSHQQKTNSATQNDSRLIIQTQEVMFKSSSLQN